MPHKDPDARREYTRKAMAARRARLKANRLAERERRIGARQPLAAADAAWFAGMFEGEGTVTITKSRDFSRCFASLTNTDREIVEAFHAQWPGNIIGQKAPRRAEHRAAYTWRISSEQLVVFLEDLMPYFRTTSRRERAQLVLECQRLRWSGQNLADYRQRVTALHMRVRELNHRGAPLAEEAARDRRADSAPRSAA